MSASFLAHGASLTSFKTHDGRETILKFDNPANYSRPENPFFGATIGRVANRIYGGQIDDVAGVPYSLPTEPDNVTLHGFNGWDKQDWKESTEGTSTVFTLVSDHLDQGFPGKVTTRAIYTPYSAVDPVDGIEKFYVELKYEAELTDDSPVDETVVSITNHNFFNISPSGDSHDGSKLKVLSKKYIVHDENNLADSAVPPTGEIKDHPVIPKDLSFFSLDKDAPFIDHAFISAPGDRLKFDGLDTSGKAPKLLAHLYHPDTKINIQVLSTEPVFQVYTGEYMNVPVLPGESRTWNPRTGFAVEPARPTNAANHPEWRPWVTLKKGDKYGSKIVYVNWVGETVTD